MSDLKNYIKKRKIRQKVFAKNYDEGYSAMSRREKNINPVERCRLWKKNL
jgi:hypothetical protein